MKFTTIAHASANINRTHNTSVAFYLVDNSERFMEELKDSGINEFLNCLTNNLKSIEIIEKIQENRSIINVVCYIPNDKPFLDNMSYLTKNAIIMDYNILDSIKSIIFNKRIEIYANQISLARDYALSDIGTIEIQFTANGVFSS